MKILVVEDDPAIAHTLQILLSECRYAVDVAPDGETGLQMAEAYAYDLILLDLLLPGLDGISVCQTLREQGMKTPILLLTGQGSGHQKAIALNAGADDYVVKPFDTEELVARIQALLRRGEATYLPVLTWGQLSIDPSTQNVSYNTQLITLTPKEYAILDLFLRNPQRVMSARTILDQVWSSLESPGEEAVRVHIKEIRHKLKGAGAPKDLIKTKHGVGYQLNPLYDSPLASQPVEQLNVPQIAELSAVNDELRRTLEQVRSLQAELQQKNEALESAYQTIANEQQQLQGVRDELEQRVIERTAELQTLYDEAPCGYHSLDAEGRFVAINQTELTMLGYTREEVIGKKATDFLTPDAQQIFAKNFPQFIQRGWVKNLEFTFVRKDGTLLPVNVNATAVRDAEGHYLMCRSIVTDMSDRKQLEQSLQTSEAKLSRILDSAIVAIASFYVYANREWQYEYWSAGCTKLFGYALEDLTDQHFWISQVYPDDRDQVLMPLFEDFFAERDAVAEYRFRRKDGEIRWFSSSYSSRKIADDCWNITTVNFDITDRKRAELTLQRQIQQEYLLSEIAQEIRQSLNVEDVLARTVERVRDYLQCDRVIIFRFRPNRQGDVITESIGEGWISILSTTIYDPCFDDRYIEPYRQGRVAALSDINQGNLEPCYVDLLESFQIQANLVAPILQGDILWGLLIAHHCAAPHQWEPVEIAALQRLATQVGIAVQQSQLYEQTHAELLKRQRIQKILEENEQQLQAVLNNSPAIIYLVDTDNKLLLVNTSYANRLSTTPEQLIGESIFSLWPADIAQRFAAQNQTVLQTGQLIELEEVVPLPDGIHTYITAKFPLFDTEGKPYAVCGISTDLTDRKRAEQQIQEQANLLDIASDAIFVRDLDNRILYWNQGAVDLYGWQASEAMGQKVDELLQCPESNLETLLERLSPTGEWLGEVCNRTKSGQSVTVSTRWTLVRDETGRPQRILAVDTDITQKKQLEAQFYRDQRLESLGNLAGGIAHDLNNILTPILTISQLLRMYPPKDEVRSHELLQLIEDSASRGASLVKQILTFTRGSGEVRAPVQVAPVVQEVASVITQTFPKSIQIHQTIPASLSATVSADSTYLHQVLMNLCVNARDAMPDGGTLSLSVNECWVDSDLAQGFLDAHVGHYVVITVADTGTGIPPEIRDLIFDPFFTTKSSGEGTGLGLATVAGIVKEYGGFLQIWSTVGEGTQVKVYLPAIEAVATPSKAPQNRVDGQGETILVVDDETAILAGTQVLLESHHYTVLTANGGSKAIALYDQHRDEIQVVVLDIMMPDMDGITLIERLKAMNPTIKIIALSGLSQHRKQALATGASLFFMKPYASDTLMHSIRRLIESSPTTT